MRAADSYQVTLKQTITQNQQGFTLVEIMVVVVILAISAGMMTLSVGGSESRQNMAFYEHLQSNLSYIRLLSSEQMQPYGLAIKLAQGDNPNQLVVVKLDNAFSQQSQNPSSEPPTWQLEKKIQPLDVPKNIEVKINSLDNNQSNQPSPSWLIGNDAPPIVWFGTGEATPVQITIQKKNYNDNQIYPIGDPIVVDQAGAIEVAK